MYFALFPQAGVKVRAPCRGLTAPPSTVKFKTPPPKVRPQIENPLRPFWAK